MRRLRNLLYFLGFSVILVAALSIFTPNATAQEETAPPTAIPSRVPTPVETAIPCPENGRAPTPTPTLAAADWDYEEDSFDEQFTTEPVMENLSECVQNIKVTFRGLTPGETDKYVLCTGEECLNNIAGAAAALNSCKNFISTNGTSDEDCNLKKFSSDGEGNVTIKVCGDGSSRVKAENACPDNSNKNYFHGGNMYFVALYRVGGEKVASKMLIPAGFFVARSYPKLSINPNQGITTKTSLQVDLSQDFYRIGGEKRNNYQVILTGGEGYRLGTCIAFGKANETRKETFTNLTIGTYVLTIKEQINEPRGVSTNPLNYVPGVGAIKTGIELYKEVGRQNDDCQGGFTYYQIRCRVAPEKGPGGTCSKIEDGKDPKGEEYKAFLKDLSALKKTGASVSFPCGNGRGNPVKNPANCKEIITAIGPIQVSVQGLIRTLFRFTLTLAGIAGVIILIYSGYLLMLSRGDKEKLSAARETITAAIVGLLFIILSIVILEIIGVDILRIPGFSR